MKRSDLVAGGEYYWAGDRGWEDRSGHGHWGKAVVQDVGCWAEPKGQWERQRKPYRVKSGAGVLVTLYVYSTSHVKEDGTLDTVVQLASLRGPYKQTKALVDARAAARLEAEKLASLQSARALEVARAAAEWAVELGYPSATVHRREHGRAFVLIDGEEFDQILRKMVG